MSFLSRRLFLLQILFFVTACATGIRSSKHLRSVIGVISYQEGKETIERFSRFCEYIGKRTNTIIELEPAFNEHIAIERLKNTTWSLVFATSGLAALGKAKYQYNPIFPLQENTRSYSILVARANSKLKKISDLKDETVALGLPGSATGYYLPLSKLYGLTLGDIIFAATPERILELVLEKRAVVGAMSREEFIRYSPQFDRSKFRVLFTDPRKIPPGSVLISPNLERNRQSFIIEYMKEAPPALIQETGYIPNGKVPEYQDLISAIEKISNIEEHIHSKPARIF